MGRFERKPEGEPLIYDDPIMGDKRRYTHVTFALGFRVSRELWQDDLYGPMKRMSKELAKSARQTVELEFATVIDDAFTGASILGADGKALCATDHPLLVGGTYQNRPTVHTDLGVGALRSSIERLENTVDERGLPIAIASGINVIVGTTFQWVAKEMLSPQTAQAPYTNENQINAFRDMNLSYMVYHYGADPDAWLALVKGVHDLKFFWRQKPLFENGDDFDTKDAKFSGFMRFSYGFTDWRGTDGSSGG